MNLPDFGIGITEQEATIELVIALYQQGRLTVAKAADILGVPRLDVQQLLAERGIPLTYSLTDLDEDMRGLHEQYNA